MDAFSIFTIIFNTVWVFFWFWFGTKLVQKMKAKENRLLEEMDRESFIIKNLVMIKTEVHDGVIFAFNEKNDSFIAQGTTIESVAESAYKYKKIDLACIKYLETDFWIINGKISKVNVTLL